MGQFTESLVLMVVLLNPFVLSVYLIDLVKELEFRILAQHIVRAGATSVLVFWIFAYLGDGHCQVNSAYGTILG